MKIPRPRLPRLPKPIKLRIAVILFVTFGLYYVASAVVNAAFGNWWSALSNIIFAIAVAVYGMLIRTTNMQRKLIDDVIESNQRLLDTLQAEMRTRTMEDLERQRRATWS